MNHKQLQLSIEYNKMMINLSRDSFFRYRVILFLPKAPFHNLKRIKNIKYRAYKTLLNQFYVIDDKFDKSKETTLDNYTQLPFQADVNFI